MKKRIVLLTTLAAMLVAAMALSGVAQAKPTSVSPDAKCETLAIQTLGYGFNPAYYTFHGGTEGPDDFSLTGAEGQPDVFCGFGGEDVIGTLANGDIFLGGSGNDYVTDNFGTFFYGGEGDDGVDTNEATGTFNGGAGNDTVANNYYIFYGGAGNDTVGVSNLVDGIFYGGRGNDGVNENHGVFYGGEGDDLVSVNFDPGYFDGGPGTDRVNTNNGGTIINVELL